MSDTAQHSWHLHGPTCTVTRVVPPTGPAHVAIHVPDLDTTYQLTPTQALALAEELRELADLLAGAAGLPDEPENPTTPETCK